MPRISLFRGMPGSGKTEAARKLQTRLGCMLIEPDALLIQDGVYLYTPDRYAKARERCLNMVTDISLVGADVVYADVLATVAEINRVIQSYCIGWAKPEIVVLDMPLLTVDESMARNRHNVRREDIERMAREWQPWEGQ